jgi:outer membrane protein assembly factor BamE (lipoprotein component of BamABCDE complex)
MFSKFNLVMGSLLVVSMLTACSESESPSAPEKATDNSTELSSAPTPTNQVSPTPVMEPATANIEVGMTEASVLELLGEPDVAQTYSIDSLNITHKEWNTEAGLTSVQFQNGEVKFYQFIPMSAK